MSEEQLASIKESGPKRGIKIGNAPLPPPSPLKAPLPLPSPFPMSTGTTTRDSTQCPRRTRKPPSTRYFADSMIWSSPWPNPTSPGPKGIWRYSKETSKALSRPSTPSASRAQITPPSWTSLRWPTRPSTLDSNSSNNKPVAMQAQCPTPQEAMKRVANSLHTKAPSGPANKCPPLHTWVFVSLICCLAVHHLGAVTSLLPTRTSPSPLDVIRAPRAAQNNSHKPPLPPNRTCPLCMLDMPRIKPHLTECKVIPPLHKRTDMYHDKYTNAFCNTFTELTVEICRRISIRDSFVLWKKYSIYVFVVSGHPL